MVAGSRYAERLRRESRKRFRGKASRLYRRGGTIISMTDETTAPNGAAYVHALSFSGTTAPQRAVSARLEPARARQGACSAGGRADFRSRRRGCAGGQGGGARHCRGGAERRRLRAARADPAGQRALYGV